MAIDVLEFSIRRHTKRTIELHRMIDLEVPTPKDPRNSQRTGFSFSRFCIPQLAAYQGRAIYMDADMLVFRDIEELWELPFDGCKVLIQQDLGPDLKSMTKENAPATRVKQCAVMLLDCNRLDWDISKIVDGLDRGDYNYDQLLSQLCILDESQIGYSVPFEWNSLEHYDAQTRLIHYTDMGTQPWVSVKNHNSELWLNEVRLMLTQGALTVSKIQNEIDLGYFRPSLLRDLKWRHWLPKFARSYHDRAAQAFDALQGFVPHKAVYEAKRKRKKAVQDFEKRINVSAPQ